MIIADTSVWINFFRFGLPRFKERLEKGDVAMHTVVIGELATGNLKQRQDTLQTLQHLPCAQEGLPNECLDFIESHRLYGRGLGWNDVQLLVSARLSHMPIWSLDQPLADAAKRFHLNWT